MSNQTALTKKELDPKTYPQRTKQQNKALHVLFTLLANELNDAGLDMRKTLKPDVAIPWTGKAVKEWIWRPIQQAQLNKDSTTELTTVEIDQVFETINRYIGEHHGLHVAFPSIQDIILQQEAYAKEQAEKRRKVKVMKDKVTEFINSQENLSPEQAKILNDHLFDLIDNDYAKGSK